MSVKKLNTLPRTAKANTVYILAPRNSNPKYYNERTNRNIGWISEEEQQILKGKTVGIAGCGGMGGLLAQTLLRCGVGTIKIADNSYFDNTNINRQLAATRFSNGTQKALSTAKILRETTDDAAIHVYPDGIQENTTDEFVDGCDLVCDQIEFWAVGARILLHLHAYEKNITIYNANTIGFGTRLFHFTRDSMSMEECLGMRYVEARELEQKINAKTANSDEKSRVMRAVIDGLMPDIPDYTLITNYSYGHSDVFYQRLRQEEVVSIMASNCPMAAGFLANQVILYLLKDSTIKRDIKLPPCMPKYVYFDSAYMEIKVCELNK
ncbi:MAG: ThiF family adenylyltransferase [Gammaproteobacteria bacterium]|nr:ThiF family adenylyltransferase [Gammaproteobacteria bacterium]MCW5582405.1 ThiF family adenylyltransferase [Gammaproteobacteria bacterium]